LLLFFIFVLDKEEDRQEEEQVQSHDTMAHLNLCLPFFPFVQVGGIGNKGEELSQPDLHPEDVEVWAP
jgi:hypothetical protein